MKHPKTLHCAALAAIFAAQTAALGSVNDYAYCAEITVAGAAEGVSLANFPALVRVSAARIDGFAYSQLSSPTDGADLRFTDAEGHFLPHDIDTWNPDGESLVWVSVPTLANGEKITMRWGNASPVETNDPATVWSAAGYVQVWHFSTGVTTDATGRGLSLTLGGSGIQASSDSLLGGCYTNTATDSAKNFIAVPQHDSLLTNIAVRTVSGWYCPDENFKTGNNFVTEFFTSKDASSDNGMELFYLNGNYRLRADDQSTDIGGWVAYPSLFEWLFIGARFSTDGDGKLYGAMFRQGAELTKYSGVLNSTISSTECDFAMGNFNNHKNYAGSRPFHGSMDELRINQGALSAEWMKEEYATVAIDGYLTYGASDLRPYVAFLRADEADTLPAAYGVPEATFSDVEAAVAATVAAKNDGRPSATLYIAPGTYRAQNDALRATNGVSIVGIGAREETIITGPEGSDSTAWDHRVLLLSDGGFLANVTIRGTYRTQWDSADKSTGNWNRRGSALLLEGTGTTASNIVVCGATAYRWGANEFEGAVALLDSSRLTDSVVSGNSGSFIGAGVNARAHTLVRRCVISGNRADKVSGGTAKTSGGGVYLRDYAQLVDCLVVSNRASVTGGAVFHDYGQNEKDGGIFNCTIADNSAATHGAIYANQYGSIVNSIVYGNTSDNASAAITNSNANYAGEYYVVNCVLGEALPDTLTGASGNQIANPRFTDAANGDYTLRASSKCIDAGENTARVGLGTPSTWLALNYVPHCHNDEPDTWDGAPDIGCYESTNVRQDATVVVFR